MHRAEIIDRIRDREEPWDLIVIGGGATGVGCALDAATRGLDVLLLEQHDLGKGTSSRSTKLIHGGVRYLRQGNISLVREALHERAILFKNAAHVVRKQEFVIPCYSLWQKVSYGLGLKLYDLLAGKDGIGRSRILSRCKVIDRLPSISDHGLNGGVLYYDGQFDDARLLIDLAITAQDHGAAILNYAGVTAFVFGSDGKISGVEFKDMEIGAKHVARATSVINASGIFTDSVRMLSSTAVDPVLTFSQGIHLVFDHKFLPSTSAVMIPKTADGRVLFCIPWHERLVVGTTDTEVSSPKLEPKALEAEVDFVLDNLKKYLDPSPNHDDILSVFAGIRPLVASHKAAKTSAISRGHDLFVDTNGLVTITGGKWTTYRRMAEDAVDRSIAEAGFKSRACVTQDTAIRARGRQRAGADPLAKTTCSREDVIEAVRYEFARTIEDVLARRTRVLFLDANGALALAQEVADLMAKELGKDEVWIEEQITSFKSTAAAYKRHRIPTR
jgi:glycerol-3-phosphate dehydrogenase